MIYIFSPGDFAFSDEARQLREQFVKSPWLVDTAFVQSHFRSLYLVDKHVRLSSVGLVSKSIDLLLQIDRVGDITALSNLTELSLTGNNIEQIPGAHLPDSLQVQCDITRTFANAHTQLQHSGVTAVPQQDI